MSYYCCEYAGFIDHEKEIKQLMENDKEKHVFITMHSLHHCDYKDVELVSSNDKNPLIVETKVKLSSGHLMDQIYIYKLINMTDDISNKLLLEETTIDPITPFSLKNGTVI